MICHRHFVTLNPDLSSGQVYFGVSRSIFRHDKLFKGQHGLAHSWQEQLFTAQGKNHFREASKKNGGRPLSQIAGEGVPSDQVIEFSKPNLLQTLLNHPGREIGEVGRQIV